MVAMPLRTSARTSNAAPQDRTAIRAARKRARLLPAIDRWLRYRTALMNGRPLVVFRSTQILRTGRVWAAFARKREARYGRATRDAAVEAALRLAAPNGYFCATPSKAYSRMSVVYFCCAILKSS